MTERKLTQLRAVISRSPQAFTPRYERFSSQPRTQVAVSKSAVSPDTTDLRMPDMLGAMLLGMRALALLVALVAPVFLLGYLIIGGHGDTGWLVSSILFIY